MWLSVHRLARTWPALMSVGLTVVVATSAATSVWRVVPVHRTHFWTHELTSVSPGEWPA